MVARGDLGVELSLERVPAIQKFLIEASNNLQKVLPNYIKFINLLSSARHYCHSNVADYDRQSCPHKSMSILFYLLSYLFRPRLVMSLMPFSMDLMLSWYFNNLIDYF